MFMATRLRLTAAFLFCLALAVPLRAQRNQPDPLTPDQQDKIAEAGIDPDARIALYTKFIDEHAQALEILSKRHESARDGRIDSELQSFSALVDELSSNLDEYGGRKADLRKSLKTLDDSIPRWQQMLANLPKDSTFQISRDEVADALGDLTTQTKQLTTSQATFFKEHKDAKGEQRAEPQ